jgi:hypothetical protein
MGCGHRNQKPPAPSDPAKAKQALTEALDAWRTGATADSLREKKPPVIVDDYSWKSDDKLVSYQIQGNGTPSGTRVTFTTNLEVRNSAGATQRTAATYIVATEPILTIHRSDWAEESQSASTVRRTSED